VEAAGVGAAAAAAAAQRVAGEGKAGPSVGAAAAAGQGSAAIGSASGVTSGRVAAAAAAAEIGQPGVLQRSPAPIFAEVRAAEKEVCCQGLRSAFGHLSLLVSPLLLLLCLPDF
jgi:hypothetical protein